MRLELDVVADLEPARAGVRHVGSHQQRAGADRQRDVGDEVAVAVLGAPHPHVAVADEGGSSPPKTEW
jgi:hypothetical protein